MSYWEEENKRSKDRLEYLWFKFNERYSVESLGRLFPKAKKKKFIEIIGNIYAKEKVLLDQDRQELGKRIESMFYPK